MTINNLSTPDMREAFSEDEDFLREFNDFLDELPPSEPAPEDFPRYACPWAINDEIREDNLVLA